MAAGWNDGGGRMTVEQIRNRPSLAPPTTPFRQWGGLYLLMVLGLLAFLDRGILALLVQSIKADMHLTDFQLGLLQGIAFALFYTICGLPLGWLVDRWSRRGLIGLSVVIWSIAAASCGLIQNFWQFLLGRFSVGFGEAGLAPASYSLISDLFPRHKITTALTIYAFGASIGPALAVAIGGMMLGAAKHGVMTLPLLGALPAWRAVLILTGLPGLLLAPLVLLVPDRRRRPSTAKHRPRGELLAFLKARAVFFTCHFLGFGSIALIAYGEGAWTPAYLMRIHGWSPTQVGLTVAVAKLVPALVGSFVGAVIVDRMFVRGRMAAHFEYYILGALVITVAGVCAFVTRNVYVTIGLLSVCYLFMPMAGFASAAQQLVTPPHLRGQVAAVYLFVISIMGLGFGPPIVATFTDFVFHDEHKLGLSIAAMIGIFGPFAALCFAVGRRSMREAVDQAAPYSTDAALPDEAPARA
jgi:MFS family permease